MIIGDWFPHANSVLIVFWLYCLTFLSRVDKKIVLSVSVNFLNARVECINGNGRMLIDYFRLPSKRNNSFSESCSRLPLFTPCTDGSDAFLTVG